jgi:ABC-2 family transporter
MTVLTVPARPEQDANLRPVPWRQMAWVTWRQHRLALAGAAALLGGAAIYLWLAGLRLHHAAAAAAACHPVSSFACQTLAGGLQNDSSAALSVAALMQAVPALIGAFTGAPVLARELETGTFRYAWTQGIGRRRWILAKLVPLAITVAAAAWLFSLLFSWYYQPVFTAGLQIPLDPKLFGLRGIAFAAWTLAAFCIGALAGMLIRRVVPAIAATLAAYAGLAFVTGLYLRQHYLAPLAVGNLPQALANTINPQLSPVPRNAWLLGQWWTHDGTTIGQSTLNQAMFTAAQQVKPVLHSKSQKPQAILDILHYLTQHGYTYWTSYQPGSRFWPLQWIEGGWLLALSALLITATLWLVGHKAA